MALDIKITQHEEFLEAVVTGTYDMREAVDKFPHILSACGLRGLSKILIDFRSLIGTPAATEKIIYAYGVQGHYNNHISTGGQALKIAYVGSAPIVSTYEPGLEHAKENGLPIDLFTNIAEAYEWLGIGSPPEQ